MIKNLFKEKGQGTIEYLVIIAIVIIVALIVIGLITNLTDFERVTSTSNKIDAKTSGLFSITETAVNTDGNYLLRIKSLSNENITINSITVGDNTNTFLQQLPLGAAENFIIQTADFCVEGHTTTAQVTITYTNKYNLPKTEIVKQVSFDCTNYTISDVAETGIAESNCDEGGTYVNDGCWYGGTIAVKDMTCTQICAEHGGCIEATDDSSCSIMKELGFPCTNCWRPDAGWSPAVLDSDTGNCIYKETFSCDAVPDTWWYRVCQCLN